MKITSYEVNELTASVDNKTAFVVCSSGETLNYCWSNEMLPRAHALFGVFHLLNKY